MSTIEIKNISKKFGETAVLKDISLTLSPNKIYGLLGRNGAGKSTLLNIITNKTFADSGDVFIDGKSAVENDEMQGRIFYSSVRQIHPMEMNVENGFEWAKAFYPTFDTQEAYRLATQFRLDTKKRINKLSTGYLSVFKLILALASNTEVVLYDEPVLGLDVNHREMFYKELLKNYSENPKTIVISTHLIDEISSFLEEIIIIRDGEIILAQSVEKAIRDTYSVSGDMESVEKYIEDKKVLRKEVFGKSETAIIFHDRDNARKENYKKLGLEPASVKLQELLIGLTRNEGEE